MIKIEKGIVISIVVLILFSVGMLYYSSTIEPTACLLEDLSRYDGKYVKFRGLAVRVFEYTGGTGIELKSLNKSRSERVTVFTGESIDDVEPGSLLEILGIVSNAGRVVNAYLIRILMRCYETTLEEVLKNPEYFLGLHVLLTGNITSVRFLENRSRLIITDGIYEAKVYLQYEYFGDTIGLHFYGIFDGYKIVCYPEPYGIYTDGSSIPIPSIPISKLKDYVGKEVHVIGNILSYEVYGYFFYLVDGKFRIRCYSEVVPHNGTVVGKLQYNSYEGYYYLSVIKYERENSKA